LFVRLFVYLFIYLFIYQFIYHLLLSTQNTIKLGACYPIAGDRGYIQIKLSQQSPVGFVSVGEIPNEQALNISSQPRDFEVRCISTEDPDGYHFLNGEYKAGNNQVAVQLFEV
jgi:hypothetical protein